MYSTASCSPSFACSGGRYDITMCLPTDGPAPADVTYERRPWASVSGVPSRSGVKRYPLGREPVVTPDGKPIADAHGRRSYVTSTGAGPSLGKHILMAYLPPEHAVESAKLAVEYMTELYPVTVDIVGSRAPFDPENARIRS